MNYKPNCARSDDRNLILGARGYSAYDTNKIAVEYADIPNLVREIFTHARSYSTKLLDACREAADLRDPDQNDVIERLKAELASPVIRRESNAVASNAEAHDHLNARAIAMGRPLGFRVCALLDLLDNALSERDLAFSVRDAAREASNRDLGARRATRRALEQLAQHVFNEPCESSESDDDLVAGIIRVLDETATTAHVVTQRVHQLLSEKQESEKALSEARAQRPGISWPRRG